MPTSPLYDTIYQQLNTQLVHTLESQCATLTLIMIGIFQSMSSQMGKIAQAMPIDTSHESKEQRIRRFLDNERITQADHYHDTVKQSLQGLKNQRAYILLDRVLLRDFHNILVVSIGFRRRSIPLTWIALDHRGSSCFAEQQRVLQDAFALLPEGVRVSVHGDSEFRSQELFTWLRGQGYDAMMGVVGATLVAESATGEQRSLVSRMEGKSGVVYMSEVYLTEARQGPVNVIAWWDTDDKGKPLVRAVMTNLPATYQTYLRGKRRMWIETVFRDWQSGGFHLDKSGLEDRARFARLLIPLVLVYLWLVAVGRWVVKRGYRKLVDDGPSKDWKYSLFQIGVAWKNRMGAYLKGIPVLLYLYL